MTRIATALLLMITGTLAVSAGAASASAVRPALLAQSSPEFDSNSIADTVSGPNAPNWLSYPGSRYELNPGKGNSTDPVNDNLALDEGNWFGRVTDLPNLLDVGLAPAGDAPAPATATSSSWYPYQLGFKASYSSPAGATVSGEDYFTDAVGTLVRSMTVSASTPVDVTLSGTIPSGETAAWDSADGVLLVTGPSWGYAIRFAQYSTPLTLNETATVSGGTWTLVKKFDAGGTLDIAFGWYVNPVSSSTAIANAIGVLRSPIPTTLAAAKANMDHLLSEVPVPASFGISRVNAVGVGTAPVTSSAVSDMYYRAWTFLIEQTENSFPDYVAEGYDYPQVSLGKAANLDDEDFAPIASMASWDSVLAMQELAYVPSEAELAFKSLEGLLSDVNSSGEIPGEVLPTRFAQAAWTLYQQTGDLATLKALYPDLKSFLLYLEANPHWSSDTSSTRDLEFVASWLQDVPYAEDIAQATGNSPDVSMWQSQVSAAMANMQTWFFSDPSELHEWYFTDTGEHYSSARPADVPQTIASALVVPALPSADKTRVLSYFYQHFDSTKSGEGFGTVKFPDVSLIAQGLIAGTAGRAAEEYINAALRDAVFAGNFSEGLQPGHGLSQTQGEAPSDFSAEQVIDFTLLANGVRIDTGTLTSFAVDPGTASFRSGFESSDPAPTLIGNIDPAGRLQGVTGQNTVLSGAEVSSGAESAGYSGTGAAGQEDYAYTELFNFSSDPLLVSPSTNLEYSIYPKTTSGNNSSCATVDIVFSDGTVLRNMKATDQFGKGMSPQAQCGTLIMNAWNRIISNIGAVAAGKSIVRIGVGYDEPNSPGGSYSGYLDDISVQ